jgi:hypothetical protein
MESKMNEVGRTAIRIGEARKDILILLPTDDLVYR